jgi:hypothetical protein
MLAGIFKREERAQATTWGVWQGEATPVVAGQRVDAESSMQLLTVYGCVRLITDSISTLPIDTYRRTGEDLKEEIGKPRWLLQPTVDLDFTSWCTQVLTSLLLHGNAYVAVLRNEAGGIVELDEDELDDEEESFCSPRPAAPGGGPDAALASTAPGKGSRTENRSRFGVPGRVGPLMRPTVADFVIASVTCMTSKLLH